MTAKNVCVSIFVNVLFIFVANLNILIIAFIFIDYFLNLHLSVNFSLV